LSDDSSHKLHMKHPFLTNYYQPPNYTSKQ
jgi:hypothetical protein